MKYQLHLILLLISLNINSDQDNILQSDKLHDEKLHKALSDSKILHLLDGNLIDKDVIKNTRWAIQEILKMQLGELDKITKQRSGSLNLQEKNYKSINTLIKEEEKKNLTDEEALYVFKERFDEITRPLMRKAKGAEKFMLKFIRASCEARNRLDSILMDWTGKENDKTFKVKIKNFKDLNIFFTDMLNFFIDFNLSCPKAVKAYESSLKK